MSTEQCSGASDPEHVERNPVADVHNDVHGHAKGIYNRERGKPSRGFVDAALCHRCTGWRRLPPAHSRLCAFAHDAVMCMSAKDQHRKWFALETVSRPRG